MALTETPSTWQLAAQEAYGVGLPTISGLAATTPHESMRPVLAALAASPFDMEGTPRVGAIDPKVRQWRADLGSSTPPARHNRWADVR